VCGHKPHRPLRHCRKPRESTGALSACVARGITKTLTKANVQTASALALETNGPVGIITLNQADRHNAFDDALIAELTDAFRAFGQSDSVRVIVLSAAGKSFSAGADLGWMRRMAGYSFEENLRDSQALAELMRTIYTTPKPVIARVQGSAFGGGVGLVACCDIAIAQVSAQFSLSEVKLGLIPAAISPYVIRAIGERNARRYFLTAERFSAAEAFQMGLVHDLAQSDEQLDEKLGVMVDALLANSPQAVAAAKALIARVAGEAITPDLIADTAERIASIRASDEGKEGLSAFLEKRKPAWLPKEE
jgi:methylglutaconyl-CoA hydratase